MPTFLIFKVDPRHSGHWNCQFEHPYEWKVIKMSLYQLQRKMPLTFACKHGYAVWVEISTNVTLKCQHELIT